MTTCSNSLNHEPGGLDRLLCRRDLRRHLPVSDMTIWRWQRAGTFPRHVTIGGRNFWREQEVREFLNAHLTPQQLERLKSNEKATSQSACKHG